MWGALQGNNLIRTFPVGIRCSSLKMRRSTSRAVLWGWCHLLSIDSSCNIQSLTMTRKVSQMLEAVGSIKDSTKGRHVSKVPALVRDSSREWKRKIIWNPERLHWPGGASNHLWYHRISLSTALPLLPCWNSHPLEIPWAFCVCSVTKWACCPRPSWLCCTKAKPIEVLWWLPGFQLKLVITYPSESVVSPGGFWFQLNYTGKSTSPVPAWSAGTWKAQGH